MLGVLGGTFDPVHYGHLRPALEVQQALGLEQVRLVPCHVPPHRPQPQATPQQRVAMLQAAIARHPVFTVDARELARPGPSYTLDTLVSMRAESPGTSLVLLVGMDAFRGLETWHRWRELLEHCHMVVMTRPGAALPERGALADYIGRHRVQEAGRLRTRAAGLLLFHTVSQLDISATGIRQLLAAGLDAGFLLPDSVLDIIREEGLYMTGKING